MGMNYHNGLTDHFDDGVKDSDNRDPAAGRSIADENYPALRGTSVYYGMIGNLPAKFSGQNDSDYFVLKIGDGTGGTVKPGAAVKIAVATGLGSGDTASNLWMEWRLVDTSYLDSFGPYGDTVFYRQSSQGSSGTLHVPSTAHAGDYIAVQFYDANLGHTHYKLALSLGTQLQEKLYASLHAGDSPAYLYTGPDFKTTVPHGVTLISDGDDGVFSSYRNDTLVNQSTITSKEFSNAVYNAGVQFAGDLGAVINQGGGIIVGEDSGVAVDGNNDAITNSGTLRGIKGSGALFLQDARNSELTNVGTISGQDTGVSDLSERDGAEIHNKGTITSPNEGIDVFTRNGLTTEIDNARGATIRGGIDAITTDAGRISLVNHGTIAGDIELDAANQNDKIVNDGKITGHVLLGSGNDTFIGLNGAGVDLFGESGNDTLTGGKSADKVNGGSGADKLTGGLGKDSLSGGPGPDIFYFKTIKDSLPGATHYDTIQDFDPHLDSVDLRAIDANTHLVGNQAFHFIGEAQFTHHPGELRYVRQGSSSVVQLDVNGDGHADAEIRLFGIKKVAPGDFDF
jgi:Ca2+-binding RTX toxin-like protein